MQLTLINSINTSSNSHFFLVVQLVTNLGCILYKNMIWRVLNQVVSQMHISVYCIFEPS